MRAKAECAVCMAVPRPKVLCVGREHHKLPGSFAADIPGRRKDQQLLSHKWATTSLPQGVILGNCLTLITRLMTAHKNSNNAVGGGWWSSFPVCSQIKTDGRLVELSGWHIYIMNAYIYTLHRVLIRLQLAWVMQTSGLTQTVPLLSPSPATPPESKQPKRQSTCYKHYHGQ